MIDGGEKRNRQLAFELQNSHLCEKRSKLVLIQRPGGTLKWPVDQSAPIGTLRWGANSGVPQPHPQGFSHPSHFIRKKPWE